MGTPLKGKPIPVVEKTDHGFQLRDTALSKILLEPRVKDRHVVVVSVAGEYRKGKSFLLNFFLRYLSAPNDRNWLGNTGSLLKGFSWRGGSERDTNGILMWSEPFIIKQAQEEVAVLLMDTQGTLDSQSTGKDCATVFALSTMLSSSLVYNLSMNINENNLKDLQFSTEYGRLALESSNDLKPFQTLQFLIRDWPNAHEYAYGEEGGERFLEKILQVSANQQPELKELRHHIRSCFQRIDCCLLPDPGLKARKRDFRGQLKDTEEDFQQHLKRYIELLLNPDNLVLKRINGSKVTGNELLEYFKAYMKIFQGNTLPEPKSVYQATSEANNLAAVAKAKDLYSKEMGSICEHGKPCLKQEDLEREHKRCAQMALDSFNKTTKMGGIEFSKEYEKKLKLDLEELYKIYNKLNHNKLLPIAFKALLLGLGIASGHSVGPACAIRSVTAATTTACRLAPVTTSTAFVAALELTPVARLVQAAADGVRLTPTEISCLLAALIRRE